MKNFFSFVVCVLLLSACAIKPIPITDQERRLRLFSDLQNLFEDQEDVKNAITLHEAIARALKYNMEYRVKLMEQAVERGSLKISKFDLLPALTANAGYHDRSRHSGATSMSLIDRSESLVASTSSEKIYWDVSLGLSWNVLDFGVSFVRAKQQADQIMIANELRRKAIQNIVLDVTNAYWRAVAAQRIKKDFEEALKTTQAALERSEELESRLLILPLKALENQQALLDLNQKLLEFKRGMNSATFQLASLMNLKPGTDFQVFIPDDTVLPLLPEGELELLEEAALLNRSEVREGDYKKRISRLEVRKAMLQMLPGLDLNATRSYTSNKFTYFPYWNELTGRLTYNIFNLFSGPANIEFAKTAEKLEDVRRMTLNMAVLTQVHLSLQDYQDALQNYTLAKRQETVKERIEKQVAAAKKAETTDELQSVLSRMRKLSAIMRSGMTYAGLQSSAARIYHTIGVDRVPGMVDGYDIPTLTEAIKVSMEKKWVFEKPAIEDVEVTAPGEMDDDFNEEDDGFAFIEPLNTGIVTSAGESAGKPGIITFFKNLFTKQPDKKQKTETVANKKKVKQVQKEASDNANQDKDIAVEADDDYGDSFAFAEPVNTGDEDADISAESASEKSAQISESSEPAARKIKKSDSKVWIREGFNLLDRMQEDAAVNKWEEGLKTLDKDRKVLIVGLSPNRKLMMRSLAAIGRSKPAFLVKGNFKGEKNYYLIYIPDPDKIVEARMFVKVALNIRENIPDFNVKEIIQLTDGEVATLSSIVSLKTVTIEVSTDSGANKWIKEGLVLLESNKQEAAFDVWEKGIRNYDEDRIALIVSVYRRPIAASKTLKRIGNSKTAFIVRRNFKGENAYYLLSVPEPEKFEEERDFIKGRLNIKEQIYGNTVKKIIRGMDL